MKTLIDPEQGWMFGFPKEAPDDFYVLGEDFDLQSWLESEGYPKGRIPYYTRYIEVNSDRN